MQTAAPVGFELSVPGFLVLTRFAIERVGQILG